MEPVPPTPQPAPVPPPPQPAYVPPPAPPPPDPGPQYGAGGVFKNLDWVQTGFLILGAFAMFHIIDYYRRKTKEDKANQATLSDVSQRVEQVERNFDGLVKRLSRRR